MLAVDRFMQTTSIFRREPLARGYCNTEVLKADIDVPTVPQLTTVLNAQQQTTLDVLESYTIMGSAGSCQPQPS